MTTASTAKAGLEQQAEGGDDYIKQSSGHPDLAAIARHDPPHGFDHVVDVAQLISGSAAMRSAPRTRPRPRKIAGLETKAVAVIRVQVHRYEMH